MCALSGCFKASAALYKILLQWTCEVADPFTLSDALIWLRRYFVANLNDESKAEKFLTFLGTYGYIKVVCYEDRDVPLYYPDREHLIQPEISKPLSKTAFLKRMKKAAFYRQLAIKILNRISFYCRVNRKHHLHAAIHYKNSSVVKEFSEFPSFKSCKFCADWLTEIGEYVYHNSTCSKVTINPSVFALMDYMEKSISSVVFSAADRCNVFSDLVSQITSILVSCDSFDKVDPKTVSLFKFISQRRGYQPFSQRLPRIWSRSMSVIDYQTSLQGSSASSTVSEDSLWLTEESPSPSTSTTKINDSTIEALRLAATLLCPNTCFLLTEFSILLPRIQRSGQTLGEPFLLSCADLMVEKLAPILFPSRGIQRGATSADLAIWKEVLTFAFFTQRYKECEYSDGVLEDLLKGVEAPSEDENEAEEEEERTVSENESEKTLAAEQTSSQEVAASAELTPLQSAMARLNISEAAASSLTSTPQVKTEMSAEERKQMEQRLAELGKSYSLMQLLNAILEDRSMDPREKKTRLLMFKEVHPDVFWLRFNNKEEVYEAYMSKLERRIANLPPVKRNRFFGLKRPTMLLKPSK